MSLEQAATNLAPLEAPLLVTDSLGHRAVFKMEMALQKVCQVLPSEWDSHGNRCFIAHVILSRVVGGERTFGGMVSAGMAAVETLRRRFEFV